MVCCHRFERRQEFAGGIIKGREAKDLEVGANKRRPDAFLLLLLRLIAISLHMS